MELTRRNFVAGTAVAGAAAAAAVVRPASAHAAVTAVPAWDEETDVVVVGYGASGVAAGITAAQEGIDAIVLEKSPEPDGGNLGCATGCIQTCMRPDDEDQMFEKLMHFDHGANPDDETETLYRTIIEQEMEAADWLDDLDDLEIYWVWRDYGEPAKMTGEVAWSERGDSSGSELWGNFHEIATDMGVDVRLGTPATRLVQNPDTQGDPGRHRREGRRGDRHQGQEGRHPGLRRLCRQPPDAAVLHRLGRPLLAVGHAQQHRRRHHDGPVRRRPAVAHVRLRSTGSPCYKLPSEEVGCSVTMLAAGHYKAASSWILREPRRRALHQRDRRHQPLAAVVPRPHRVVRHGQEHGRVQEPALLDGLRPGYL